MNAEDEDAATPDAPVSRPAARVVCVDPRRRVLLLHWHDPVSDEAFWEPPGGGIEPGETAWDAARRELSEETGLPGSVVTRISTPVERDFHWAGRHFRGTETFFLGLVDSPELADRTALTDEEQAALLGHGWFTVEEMDALDEPVLPCRLTDILAILEHRTTGRGRELSPGADDLYLPPGSPPTT